MIERNELYITGIGAASVVLLHILLVGFVLETALVFFGAYWAFFLLAAYVLRYRGHDSRVPWVFSAAFITATLTVGHNIVKFQEVALPGGSADLTPTAVIASFAVEFLVGAGILLTAVVGYEYLREEYF